MVDYLKNCWYVICFDDEISNERPMTRTVMNMQLALYRDSLGNPVVLSDMCPHRFAQLHYGEVIGDALRCPYHGLQFGPDGTCVHNPHGDQTIPPRAHVQSFPAIERYGMIWIWPGDREKADPAKLPDFNRTMSLSSEPTAMNRGYLHTKANYELLNDNLMDLSHVDFIHKTALRTKGGFTSKRPKVTTDSETVVAYWSYYAEEIMPVRRSGVKYPDKPGYETSRITWYPASNLELYMTVRNEDVPEEDASIIIASHFLTPETDKSCHYFYIANRNFEEKNAQLNQMMHEGTMDAFLNEDKPIVEQAQEMMGGITDIFDLDPVIVSSDPGAVHVRRLLQRLIAQEKAVTVAEAAE